MAGPGTVAVTGTADVNRIEAPVTFKGYLIVAFAAFGGIFFGYDTGWMSGVLGTIYAVDSALLLTEHRHGLLRQTIYGAELP